MRGLGRDVRRRSCGARATAARSPAWTSSVKARPTAHDSEAVPAVRRLVHAQRRPSLQADRIIHPGTGSDSVIAIRRRRVVLTMGGGGSLLTTARERVHLPAHNIDVVDTSGCGDAYCAGFIARSGSDGRRRMHETRQCGGSAGRAGPRLRRRHPRFGRHAPLHARNALAFQLTALQKSTIWIIDSRVALSW